MSLVLYHYVHCPFCLRVRLGCGLLGLPFQSRVLPYHDEITPVKLIGKKMLPIMVIDGVAKSESLDILALIDKKNQLKINQVTANKDYPDFEKYLSSLGNMVHSLAMPYWLFTPEFNEESRNYFQKKKEEKRGPFKELYRRRKEFFLETQYLLEQLSHELQPFYRSTELGLYDLMLASHLWGLYVVPEFQFSQKVHEYLQLIAENCSFDYHQDYWS